MSDWLDETETEEEAEVKADWSCTPIRTNFKQNMKQNLGTLNFRVQAMNKQLYLCEVGAGPKSKTSQNYCVLLGNELTGTEIKLVLQHECACGSPFILIL